MRPGCEPEDVGAHIVNLNVEMERAAAEARAIRAREAAIRERELPHYADAVATEAAETVRGFNLATGPRALDAVWGRDRKRPVLLPLTAITPGLRATGPGPARGA